MVFGTVVFCNDEFDVFGPTNIIRVSNIKKGSFGKVRHFISKEVEFNF